LVIALALGVSFGLLMASGQAESISEATKKILAFDALGAKPSKVYRIAYLTECGQNPYCSARRAGLQAAADKYGFEFKRFAANFNPAEQIKQVQNAVTEGFDGFLFAPTAAAAACTMWKRYLVPTGKPVVSLDLPMCEDADYSAGLAATVTMQRQAYYDTHVMNAFASCSGPCEAAAVGGFVGSDLFGFWEKAIQNGLAKYPNVTMVSDQPANFDPRVALQKIQDALLAHPNITLVVSSWDDMSRGVVQAIESAGKKPGTDVRIYSIGANKDGVAKIKAGIFNESTVLLPWEESYYAAVALIAALEGQPVNGYVNEAHLPRVMDGPATILITKENADQFEPNY
jgi:ABC-type sugar transport system substrate-binding protein